MKPRSHRGVRFAPSPTGAFHVGNFRTAWISHFIAETLGEPWVLRFEDIDRPRVVEGAMKRQLEEMAMLGLRSGDVRIQSQSIRRHWEVFVSAIRAGVVYACDCSRKEVQDALARMASAPHGEQPLYTGKCRERRSGKVSGDCTSIAWRFKFNSTDGTRDFIIARSAPELDASGVPSRESFVPAYNWACAIDDWDGMYRLLVRSWDLEPVAAQQMSIMLWLARQEGFGEEPWRTLPAVFHTALVTRNDGHRLEKRTQGVTLPELQAAGVSLPKLQDVFEKSLKLELEEITPGAILGESSRRITLKELGLV